MMHIIMLMLHEVYTVGLHLSYYCVCCVLYVKSPHGPDILENDCNLL